MFVPYIAGMILLCSGLELSPGVPEIILSPSSSLNVTCSGWASVTWRFKREENVPPFHVKNQSLTSSVLSLENVTWRHTGVYVCSENGTNDTRELSVFVPGETICFLSSSLYISHSLTLCLSDPEVWFLNNDYVMVTKTRKEGTIPCLVTDPRINVTLLERDSEMPVEGLYNPSVGYTAALEDRTYKCRGELNGQEKESIMFYVFTVLGV